MEEVKNAVVNGNDIILDARETFNVKDKDGKLFGTFSFDPSDIDLPRRINALVKYYEELQIPEMSEDMDAFYAVTDEFKQKINEALKSEGAADALFFSNPFTPMQDGSLLAEKALNAIATVIEAKSKARVNKASKRLKQYTAKYHK